LTDPREQRVVEDLRQVFTGDLAGFVWSALGRLQRAKASGKGLRQVLSALYTAFDLRRRRRAGSPLHARQSQQEYLLGDFVAPSV